MKLNKIHFAVEGRNGFYAIDEYKNPEGDKLSGCTRHVESFKTQKQANRVCGYLNDMAFQLNQAIDLLEQAQASLPDAWFAEEHNTPRDLIENTDQFLSNYK